MTYLVVADVRFLDQVLRTSGVEYPFLRDTEQARPLTFDGGNCSFTNGLVVCQLIRQPSECRNHESLGVHLTLSRAPIRERYVSVLRVVVVTTSLELLRDERAVCHEPCPFSYVTSDSFNRGLLSEHALIA